VTAGTTRMQRLSMPLARDAIRQLTATNGGCTRPVQLRRTDTATGHVDQLLVPCGSTREDQCPACAKRAVSLRAQQCREGWHLTADPEPPAPVADDEQEAWLVLRAEAQVRRDHALTANADTSMLDELIGELDDHITVAGIRGAVTAPDDDRPRARRSRSTRRRQDAPDLPSRPIAKTTTGRTYTSSDGKTWQPSMFLTLTCDSYGKVGPDGIPAEPAKYDYTRAARDALHFAALFDRFIQNLRRYAGRDVQYFATIEPQKRLAPHVHLAIRGTISRADLRQIIAATYHQVWWPPAREVRHSDDELPTWHEASGSYLDAATGELLPSWDDALDAIGPHAEPLHVARFGPGSMPRASSPAAKTLVAASAT
jgi:Replication initiator protein, pSAM2